MSEAPEPSPDSRRSPRISPALGLLVAIIALEAGALAWLTVFLVYELIVARPDSYPSAVGLILIAGIGAAWLAAIAVNTLRGRAWIRGAVVTVHVLQIAVAIGSFQGLFARQDIGWLLLVPAVVVLLLLFTKSVVAATSRREG